MADVDLKLDRGVTAPNMVVNPLDGRDSINTGASLLSVLLDVTKACFASQAGDDINGYTVVFQSTNSNSVPLGGSRSIPPDGFFSVSFGTGVSVVQDGPVVSIQSSLIPNGNRKRLKRCAPPPSVPKSGTLLVTDDSSANYGDIREDDMISPFGEDIEDVDYELEYEQCLPDGTP